MEVDHSPFGRQFCFQSNFNISPDRRRYLATTFNQRIAFTYLRPRDTWDTQLVLLSETRIVSTSGVVSCGPEEHRQNRCDDTRDVAVPP